MSRKSTIIRGTFLLTFAGIITKIIGFYYRIFLNKQIGATGLGLYQLVFPVFIIGFAFCCVGIQTSMSRMIAENLDDSGMCMKILITATFYSVILSCVVWLFCYFKAEFIAINFLKNTRCTSLVRILGFSFVPASIHACISGYYYGMKKTALPAISQLLEQISRVAVVYLMLKMPENKIDIVMWGLVFGEGFGAIVSITYLSFEQMFAKHNKESGNCFVYGRIKNGNYKSGIKKMTVELFEHAIPLTFNRLGTNFLQSVEAVLFPILLCKYGYSNNESLMFFGILTGIAMPLIMFPSALTNSLSVLLLSDVATLNSTNDNKKIKETTEYTIQYTILLGIFCMGFFLITGEDVGLLVFESNLAGYYIKLASFLCPFIYLSSILKSILFGLGKTLQFFICNIVILITRIVLMILFMPMYGVNAYLFIVMMGQIIMTIYILLLLKKTKNIRFDFYKWILTPTICVLCSYVAINITMFLIKYFNFDYYGTKKAGLFYPALVLAINSMIYCIPFMIYFKKAYVLIKSGKNQ